MANVIIASGQPIERAALSEIVRAAGHQVLGEADSGYEALQMVRSAKPDLLVIATDLPKIIGLEVVRRLKVRELPPKMLLYGSETAAHLIQRCYEAGADGFVGKHEEAGGLRRAINGVLAGRRYFPDTVPAGGSVRTGGSQPNLLSALSQREVTILTYLARGLSNTEIARELSISEKTVSSHRAHLRDKLNARSLVELVDIARRHGLLPGAEADAPARGEMPGASADDIAMLRAMLDGTPLPLHVRDREGHLVACNAAFLTQNETTFEAVEGSLLTDMDWFDRAALVQLHERYLASVRTGEPVRADREMVRHGRRIVLHIWATPYRSEAGELLGMVCGSLDVTGREDMLRALALERDHSAEVTGGLERLLDALCQELAPLPTLLRDTKQQLEVDSELARHANVAAGRLEQILAAVTDVVALGRGSLRIAIARVAPVALTEQVIARQQSGAAAYGCSLSLRVSGTAADPVPLDGDAFSQLIYLMLGRQIIRCAGCSLQISLDVSPDAVGRQWLTFDIDVLPQPDAAEVSRSSRLVQAGGDLALLLSRRLVEHMHGTLQIIRSADGESGVTVRVLLA
jgi:PAS domain S-box-containing protein